MVNHGPSVNKFLGAVSQTDYTKDFVTRPDATLATAACPHDNW